MGGLLPDLAGPREPDGEPPRAAPPAGHDRRAPTPPRRGRRPAHPHRRLGRHGRHRRHPRPRRGARRPRRHRHHRPRADRRRRRRARDGASTGACAFEVVVGEEVTTLGGHLLALFIERPIRPYRSLRTTIADIHDAGGLAIPAHPLVPYPLCAQGWVLRRLLDDPRSGGPSRRARDVQPDRARPTVARSGRALRRPARPARGRQQRRPCARRDRHRLDDVRGPDRRGPAARHRDRHDDATAARSTARRGQVGVFGQQLRKRAVDARDEVRGRVRRDGTGRDHGYPGGRAAARYEPPTLGPSRSSRRRTAADRGDA